MPPASLYIHVPFCARRCPYCDFAVSVNGRAEFRAAYVEALQLELRGQLCSQAHTVENQARISGNQSRIPENQGRVSENQAHIVENQAGIGLNRVAVAEEESVAGREKITIQTLFCGGGTPTELSAAQLNSLLDAVRACVTLAPGAEVSLEANPENLERDTLRELRAGGWNRLSLGAQGFDDATLRFLGRRHDGSRISQVVEWAREAGWENISLDLIFGAPLQSLDVWRDTLRRAVELDVPHVSAYGLTVETGTALGQRAAKGAFVALDDDHLADRMDAASEVLEGAGLERYEVSNWAKAGFECRHNQNYWRGGSYFATGCGAHGHFDGERFWNERDTKTYTARMTQSGSARVETERLSERERLVERIATGLRTREGVALNSSEAELLQPTLTFLCGEGVLKFHDGWLRPEKPGFALADGLASRLIGHIL